MATHKSAEKRARQNEKRAARNSAHMSAMKTAIKKLREAIEKKRVDELDSLLQATQSIIAKTRKYGIIHRNNMARRISRLSMAVNKVKDTVSK